VLARPQPWLQAGKYVSALASDDAGPADQVRDRHDGHAGHSPEGQEH